VAAFLGGRLGFAQIPELIDRVCQAMPVSGVDDLDAVLATDTEARRLAEQLLREAV
jgi:1-deoxy-D-xylulose-5-phosphate reductoisomerase